MANQASQNHDDLGFIPNEDHSDIGFVENEPDHSTLAKVVKSVSDYMPSVMVGKQLAKEAAKNPSGAAQTALEHFGDTLTMGHLPQIQAAVEPAQSKLLDLMTGQSVTKDLGNYVQRRDENISRIKQQGEEYPKASLAGTGAGILTQAPLLGAAVPVNAAQIPGRMVQAGAIGGGIGFASNPGDKPGEVGGDLQIGDRLKNAAMMAPLGIAGQGIAEGLGALGGKIAQSAEEFAHEKALQAAGAMKKDFKEIFDKDKLDALGEVLLNKDNKLVPTFSSLKGISSNIDAAHEAAGAEIGNIIKPISEEMGGVISAKNIALQLSQDPAIAEMSKIPGHEGIAERVNGYLNTLYKNGDNMTLEQAQKLRQGIDKSINFSKRIPDMAGSQPYLAKIRNAIADKMNEVVNIYEEVTGASMPMDHLKMTNRAYSQLTQLKDISDNRVASIAANRAIGLTDTIAGGAGASVGASIGAASGLPGAAKVGAVIGGAAGAGVNKAGRTFGPALMANIAHGVVGPASELGPALQQTISQNPAVLPLLQQEVINRQKTPVDRRLEANRNLGSVKK